MGCNYSTHSHLGIIGSQYVAEVSSWNTEVNGVTHDNDPLVHQIKIGGGVMYDLRQQAAPVQRVGSTGCTNILLSFLKQINVPTRQNFWLKRSVIFVTEFRARHELGARNFHLKPCMFTWAKIGSPFEVIILAL